MKTEKVFFESEGRKVAAVLHLPETGNAPCVIASHGLLSSKDSDKYIGLGERLVREGMALLRFDFRGIGESEGRLEDDTISGRIRDLGAAVGFVKSRIGLGDRIGLLGSSLGGYVSLIRASMEEGIQAVVTWATPFHLDNLRSKKPDENAPPPAEAFFRDLPRHRLSAILPRVTHCLVIHGEEDDLVPVDQAWEIFNLLGSPKEIHTLEGADHRLTQPSSRQRALDLSTDWFKRLFRS
jgi:uncharacterized protein